VPRLGPFVPIGIYADRVGRIPRLLLVSAVTAVTALVAPGGAAAGAPAFRFGVAAGVVTAHSAIIWGSVTGADELRAEIATDSDFRPLVASKSVSAETEHDFAVQARFGGLKPDRRYRYRFCLEGSQTCSAKGRFTTAPEPGEAATIRFAFTGDTDATAVPPATEPFWGTFDVFDAMRAEGNDFNIHLGDTIYSDSEVPGAGTPALTTEEKWGKYKLNLGQAPLTQLRGSAGFYSHWDDHEFINDFSIPEDGQELYDAGVEAFRDYAPVTYTPTDGLYRTFRWGRNLELFFLDERSFRDAKASTGGTCDNPETLAPDLAPTAPQPLRNVFAVLIPSLDQPVSQECKDTLNDPDRSLLGEAQLQTFLRDVARSKATWKVIVNETPMQQFYGLPYDRWEGYAHERVQLLKQLRKRQVKNLVFLTTDTHAAFANVVRLRTLPNDVAPANAPLDAPVDTRYNDFIAGPVSTANFWTEIDSITGTEGSGALLSDMFFKPALGMFCAQGDTDSYGEVTVSGKRLRVAYKSATGGAVLDVDDTRCGPYAMQRR
jgi:alkaline phosphatase D